MKEYCLQRMICVHKTKCIFFSFVFMVIINKCNAELYCNDGEYVSWSMNTQNKEIAQKCGYSTSYVNPRDPTMEYYGYDDHVNYCSKLCTFGTADFELYTLYVYQFLKISSDDLNGLELIENSQISAWLRTQPLDTTSVLIPGTN